MNPSVTYPDAAPFNPVSVVLLGAIGYLLAGGTGLVLGAGVASGHDSSSGF